MALGDAPGDSCGTNKQKTATDSGDSSRRHKALVVSEIPF